MIALALLAGAGAPACTIIDSLSVPPGNDAATDARGPSGDGGGGGDAGEGGLPQTDGSVPYLIGAYTQQAQTTDQNFMRLLDFEETYQVADSQGTFDSTMSATSDGAWVVYAMYPIWQGGSLAVAADGGYDDDYRAACSQVDAARTFAIRIDNDFNDGTRSWSPGPGDQSNFINATRHLAAVIRAQLPSVKIDWNTKLGATDPRPYYPQGDPNIDIISADVFMENKDFSGQDPATRWAHVLAGDGPLVADGGVPGWGLQALASFAAANGKFIALPDWGTDIDDGTFVTQMAAWIANNHVAYFGYWDSDLGGLGSSLSTHPTNQQAFRGAWGNTRYGGTFFP